MGKILNITCAKAYAITGVPIQLHMWIPLLRVRVWIKWMGCVTITVGYNTKGTTFDWWRGECFSSSRLFHFSSSIVSKIHARDGRTSDLKVSMRNEILSRHWIALNQKEHTNWTVHTHNYLILLPVPRGIHVHIAIVSTRASTQYTAVRGKCDSFDEGNFQEMLISPPSWVVSGMNTYLTEPNIAHALTFTTEFSAFIT